VPIISTQQFREEIKNEGEIQWKLMNTYQKLWRPFCIGMLTEQPKENPEAWVKVAEELREGAEFNDPGVLAYYAAWPLQVYIDSFLVSNNVTVTYTCKETWDTEEWFSSNKEGEA